MEPLQIAGESAAIAAFRREFERTAVSNAKVLITGESGVGKEIVARRIHAIGPCATSIPHDERRRLVVASHTTF